MRNHPRSFRRGLARRPALCGAALLLQLCAGAAQAQLQQGQIQGTITDPDTNKPVAGATIEVTGPALQGAQVEFTDPSGRFLITQLPPGDQYVVRVYYSNAIVERPGLRLSGGSTLTVNARIAPHAKTTVIHEHVNVDVSGGQHGSVILEEILKSTPVRGRGFESAVILAPGTVDPPRGIGGDVGVSIAGATGNENSFLIDGLNTTDPNLGLQGTRLHQAFVKEVNVITGGYQAEYGRATGGVVSVVTKGGGDEIHGSVFATWQPLQAPPRTVARLGEALGTRTRTEQDTADFGFELGGPLVKGRLWFFAGFAPTLTSRYTDRVVRTLTPDPTRPDLARGLSGALADPDYACPGYLSGSELCRGAGPLALRTSELAGRTLQLYENQRLYNWIGKLQLNLSPNHNLAVSYIGAPQTADFYNSYRTDLRTARFSQSDQIHDVTVRYLGKALGHRLQFEVMYGFHYQSQQQTPLVSDQPLISYQATAANPYSLADFETAPECQRRVESGLVFNPCPLTRYATGGGGGYNVDQTMQRHVLLASATAYAGLLGLHALKVGLDFENNSNDHWRAVTGTDYDPQNPLSGHVIYGTDPTGQRLQNLQAYASRSAVDAYGNKGVPCGAGVWCYNSFRAQTATRNYALYARDSWNVKPLPGLTVNLGLRWEAQQLFAQDGSQQIGIFDNLAPRVGLAYDFTRKGRSKIYFNYGRFYESIPIDLNDRSFSGEGLLIPGPYARDCATRSLTPGGRPVAVPEAAPGAPCSLQPGPISGGEYSNVVAGLKGQYINEIVAGVQYEVGWDVVLGLGYTFRNLGDVIEDLSVDGTQTFFIANPGVSSDPALVARLASDAQQAQQAAARAPDNAALQRAAQLAQSQLEVAKAVALFPRARRDYHAVSLTASKRLSHRFALLGSYTYSRLIGNYPGTYSASNGQNDPNISTQFDLVDLLANRDGALANDRPHNFKLTGMYTQPVSAHGTLVIGLTFSAYSGRPIDVLGRHPAEGRREVFILPRGSGGRTPTVTQVDAHVEYAHQLGKRLRLSLFGDVINLLNQQEVTNVDDEYTTSLVSPILNGKREDLLHLRTLDGTPVAYNSNYGQATAYQAPLYLRLGARLVF